MSKYGIKISKEGHDVKTAAGSELLFSSERDNLDLNNFLTATITVSGATGSKTVNHNLGYVPIILAFVDLTAMDAGFGWLPFWGFMIGAVDYSVDVDSIYFNADNLDDGDYTIYYSLSVTERIA